MGVTDDRPSIAELQCVVGDQRWRIDGDRVCDGACGEPVEIRDGSAVFTEHHVHCGTIAREIENPRHREAIAALPMFLEIAAAALALRQQEQVAARARRAVYARLEAKRVLTDAEYAATDAEDRKLKQCRDDYNAALAQVRP